MTEQQPGFLKEMHFLSGNKVQSGPVRGEGPCLQSLVRKAYVPGKGITELRRSGF